MPALAIMDIALASRENVGIALRRDLVVTHDVLELESFSDAKELFEEVDTELAAVRSRPALSLSHARTHVCTYEHTHAHTHAKGRNRQACSGALWRAAAGGREFHAQVFAVCWREGYCAGYSGRTQVCAPLPAPMSLFANCLSTYSRL